MMRMLWDTGPDLTHFLKSIPTHMTILTIHISLEQAFHIGFLVGVDLFERKCHVN